MKTEKTIREWLNELPQEIRDKAVENINANFADITMNHKTTSLIRALVSSFVWRDSIEGFDYWFDISQKYDNA